MLVCLFRGAKAGFFRGDVLGLLDDIAELKPTVFCSVPGCGTASTIKCRRAFARVGS